ncbi:DUF362 domain-containing protein, partial [bacterium]
MVKTSIACAGAALLGGFPAAAQAQAASGVVVATGESPARNVREALKALGGMASFVNKGETVVVKPNIGWDRAPEQAANTNPEVVREVIAMCLEAGAAKVKVFDRTCNDPRRCYVTSGILAAVEGMGDSRVEISHIDERRFKPVDLPQG